MMGDTRICSTLFGIDRSPQPQIRSSPNLAGRRLKVLGHDPLIGSSHGQRFGDSNHCATGCLTPSKVAPCSDSFIRHLQYPSTNSGLISMSFPTFRPTVDEFKAERANQPYSVLCGLNNSGKSLLLKNMKRALGRQSYMLGAQRFYHLYHIATQVKDPLAYETFEQQFV
jgi:hypothetical protein